MRQVARALKRAARARLYGLPGVIASPDKWVFLVGCYNSGTTLLNRILARHPDISSMPTEGQFYTDQLLVPQNLGLARAWALQPELFRLTERDRDGIDVPRLKRQWQRASKPAGCPVLMEKSPPNAARIRWLNANFNNSYFVAIVRNPYATVEGMFRRSELTLAMAANQWERSNRIMLADLQQVPRGLLITYEKLTEATSDVLDQICSFLEIDMLDKSALDGVFDIHGEKGEIRNLNHLSIGRLAEEDMRQITATTLDIQTRLGYPQRGEPDAAIGPPPTP